MRTFHVKKGEEAVVIAGADKGKRGRIITVLPKKQRVIVEGARMIKKHMRKSQQHPQGAIVEREITFDLNAMPSIRLALRNPDFTTAQRMADAMIAESVKS